MTRGGSGGRCDTADLLAGLFRDEAARLVTMAGRCAVDRTAAEDLVQEAFLRLARARGRIRDPDRTTAYLRSIVLNLARDHNRRSLVARRVLPPCQPEPPSVEQVVSARESHGELVAALRALPHRQREAVVLRYYLELPVADVAASLGVSVNSTKTHLQRGLRALQLALVPAR